MHAAKNLKIELLQDKFLPIINLNIAHYVLCINMITCYVINLSNLFIEKWYFPLLIILHGD